MLRPQKQSIVLVGDEEVGKTALVTSLVYGAGHFRERYRATDGIDFFAKTLNVNGREIGLHLWDASGQERFRSIAESYVRSAATLLIVYDVTRRESFNSAEKWLQQANAASRASRPLIALLGNKADCANGREVTLEDGKQRAKELGAHVFAEASAKTGHHVSSLFEQLATALMFPATVPLTVGHSHEHDTEDTEDTKDTEEDVPRKKCMCLALIRKVQWC
mmetsp:Transcript_38319/g.75978  ORF Transcript_38319/g.75978 Transcript_38319/m.75978 type:complete len:220 (-) Transcript_38319:97-756(-)